MRITGLTTLVGVLLLAVIAIPLVRFMVSSAAQLRSPTGGGYFNVTEYQANASSALCPTGFYIINIKASGVEIFNEISDLKIYLTLFEQNGSTLVYAAPVIKEPNGTIQAHFCIPPGVGETNVTKESLGFSGYIYGIYFISMNETATVSGNG